MSGPAAIPLEEAVLHVGLGKTGTTSVQQFLYRNRARLVEHGMLMPDTPGRTRHVGISFLMKSPATVAGLIEWQRMGEESLEEWRKRFRRNLRRELTRAGLPRALFTDEALFSCHGPAIRRLRQLTDQLARRTRVVVYLRRQDDHFVSRYQQAVKVGETARLTDFLARKWAWKYDYARQLDRWQRFLEPTRIVVRRYEPGHFAGGSLYQDFLDAIGVAASAADFTPLDRTRNDALPMEAAEFMRLLNIYRVEQEGASGYTIDNRALGTGLRELSAGRGPTLTLPEAILDRFMDRWRDSNRRVARQYFGEDTLFRAPAQDP
jgi:hypothetical protein